MENSDSGFLEFYKKGLLTDHVHPADTWGWGDRACKGQMVQDQKGGGRKQRDHRSFCDVKVIDPETQLNRWRFQLCSSFWFPWCQLSKVEGRGAGPEGITVLHQAADEDIVGG